MTTLNDVTKKKAEPSAEQKAAVELLVYDFGGVEVRVSTEDQARAAAFAANAFGTAASRAATKTGEVRFIRIDSGVKFGLKTEGLCFLG